MNTIAVGILDLKPISFIYISEMHFHLKASNFTENCLNIKKTNAPKMGNDWCNLSRIRMYIFQGNSKCWLLVRNVLYELKSLQVIKK